jgi:DNA topoisomerase-1
MAKKGVENNLVIVESPAKAKTIGKYLGAGYVVEASVGHVRDLPTAMGEIPEALRKEPWARTGVNVDSNFEPIYVVPAQKREQIAHLKRLLKDATVLWLATDEDREGESISWHLVEVLKPKIPIKRLVFHEITKGAILAALESPRDIDLNLVKAQETRRILDRLFGYEVSPVLWRKVRAGLSAGRVQSVALRLLVERELERLAFRKAAYWDLLARLAPKGGSAAASFEAELVEVGGRRVASGRDFEATTGKVQGDVVVLDERTATALAQKHAKGPATVLDVESKPYTQRPAAPFTTSTLQQEAGRKLRYAAQRTMRLAQRLYENGAITYMRTDSTTLSQQALGAARAWIAEQYGAEYLPAQARVYEGKVKNAQEAHEAIRPAGSEFRSIDDVRAEFGAEAGALYELIWKRTVASQMPDARGERISVRVGLGRVAAGEAEAVLRAAGRTLTFPGFQRAYVEGSDDPSGELSEQDRVLPPLAPGQALDVAKLEAQGHETQPPARYTEASLVKELDTRGIGRPSTWASIIAVLLERDYAFARGAALVPSWTAFVVVRLLKDHFGDVLDYEFTARMEEGLDAISRGEDDGPDYLRRWYAGERGAAGRARPGLKTLVAKSLDEVDPRKACSFPLGAGTESTVEVRVGKFGLFLSDGDRRASLPEDTVPDELTLEKANKLLDDAARAPVPLGKDPTTGEPIYVKTGRFGPYVQRGDAAPVDPAKGKRKGKGKAAAAAEGAAPAVKPKMVSLLPGMEPATMDLPTALRLLSLPRDLGEHPEDPAKAHVLARLGRFGPYIVWGAESRSIPAGTSVLEIDLAQAVALLKLPRQRRGRSAPAAPLRELGVHPGTGATLKIFDGRYGPYVSDGTLNASLSKTMDPQSLTVEQAVELLVARAEREKAGGGKRGRRGGRRFGGAKASAPPAAPSAPEGSASAPAPGGPAPKKAPAPKKGAPKAGRTPKKKPRPPE